MQKLKKGMNKFKVLFICMTMLLALLPITSYAQEATTNTDPFVKQVQNNNFIKYELTTTNPDDHYNILKGDNIDVKNVTNDTKFDLDIVVNLYKDSNKWNDYKDCVFGNKAFDSSKRVQFALPDVFIKERSSNPGPWKADISVETGKKPNIEKVVIGSYEIIDEVIKNENTGKVIVTVSFNETLDKRFKGRINSIKIPISGYFNLEQAKPQPIIPDGPNIKIELDPSQDKTVCQLKKQHRIEAKEKEETVEAEDQIDSYLPSTDSGIEKYQKSGIKPIRVFNKVEDGKEHAYVQYQVEVKGLANNIVAMENLVVTEDLSDVTNKFGTNQLKFVPGSLKLLEAVYTRDGKTSSEKNIPLVEPEMKYINKDLALGEAGYFGMTKEAWDALDKAKRNEYKKLEAFVKAQQVAFNKQNPTTRAAEVTEPNTEEEIETNQEEPTETIPEGTAEVTEPNTEEEIETNQEEPTETIPEGTAEVTEPKQKDPAEQTAPRGQDPTQEGKIETEAGEGEGQAEVNSESENEATEVKNEVPEIEEKHVVATEAGAATKPLAASAPSASQELYCFNLGTLTKNDSVVLYFQVELNKEELKDEVAQKLNKLTNDTSLSNQDRLDLTNELLSLRTLTNRAYVYFDKIEKNLYIENTANLNSEVEYTFEYHDDTNANFITSIPVTTNSGDRKQVLAASYKFTAKSNINNFSTLSEVPFKIQFTNNKDSHGKSEKEGTYIINGNSSFGVNALKYIDDVIVYEDEEHTRVAEGIKSHYDKSNHVLTFSVLNLKPSVDHEEIDKDGQKVITPVADERVLYPVAIIKDIIYEEDRTEEVTESSGEKVAPWDKKEDVEGKQKDMQRGAKDASFTAALGVDSDRGLSGYFAHTQGSSDATTIALSTQAIRKWVKKDANVPDTEKEWKYGKEVTWTITVNEWDEALKKHIQTITDPTCSIKYDESILEIAKVKGSINDLMVYGTDQLEILKLDNSDKHVKVQFYSQKTKEETLDDEVKIPFVNNKLTYDIPEKYQDDKIVLTYKTKVSDPKFFSEKNLFKNTAYTYEKHKEEDKLKDYHYDFVERILKTRYGIEKVCLNSNYAPVDANNVSKAKWMVDIHTHMNNNGSYIEDVILTDNMWFTNENLDNVQLYVADSSGKYHPENFKDYFKYESKKYFTYKNVSGVDPIENKDLENQGIYNTLKIMPEKPISSDYEKPMRFIYETAIKLPDPNSANAADKLDKFYFNKASLHLVNDKDDANKVAYDYFWKSRKSEVKKMIDKQVIEDGTQVAKKKGDKLIWTIRVNENNFLNEQLGYTDKDIVLTDKNEIKEYNRLKLANELEGSEYAYSVPVDALDAMAEAKKLSKKSRTYEAVLYDLIPKGTILDKDLSGVFKASNGADDERLYGQKIRFNHYKEEYEDKYIQEFMKLTGEYVIDDQHHNPNKDSYQSYSVTTRVVDPHVTLGNYHSKVSVKYINQTWVDKYDNDKDTKAKIANLRTIKTDSDWDKNYKGINQNLKSEDEAILAKHPLEISKTARPVEGMEIYYKLDINHDAADIVKGAGNDTIELVDESTPGTLDINWATLKIVDAKTQQVIDCRVDHEGFEKSGKFSVFIPDDKYLIMTYTATVRLQKHKNEQGEEDGTYDTEGMKLTNKVYYKEFYDPDQDGGIATITYKSNGGSAETADAFFIQKYNDKRDPIEGVKFTAEYYDGEKNDWVPINIPGTNKQRVFTSDEKGLASIDVTEQSVNTMHRVREIVDTKSEYIADHDYTYVIYSKVIKKDPTDTNTTVTISEPSAEELKNDSNYPRYTMHVQKDGTVPVLNHKKLPLKLSKIDEHEQPLAGAKISIYKYHKVFDDKLNASYVRSEEPVIKIDATKALEKKQPQQDKPVSSTTDPTAGTTIAPTAGPAATGDPAKPTPEEIEAKKKAEAIEKEQRLQKTYEDISLIPGKYVLVEEKAPNGYKAVEDQKFTIDEFGKIHLENKDSKINIIKPDIYQMNENGDYIKDSEGKDFKTEKIQVLQLRNTKENSIISFDHDGSLTVYKKTRSYLGKGSFEERMLEGADFEVVREDGSVDLFKTKTKKSDYEFRFENLTPYVNYKLVETKTPEGYEAIEPIYFYVNYLNEVKLRSSVDQSNFEPRFNVLSVYNQKPRLFFNTDYVPELSKESPATYELYEGGKLIHKFYTDAFFFDAYVQEGHTYTIKEVSVPEKYHGVEPITFYVNNDKEIVMKSSHGKDVLLSRNHRMITVINRKDGKPEKPGDKDHPNKPVKPNVPHTGVEF